jgi:hypothetical protein
MAMWLAALVCSLMLAHSTAEALDLHDFWENRCMECHGHAGAFARGHLIVENSVLVGRHHKSDLKRFLGQHEMGPTHVDGIYAMLLAQAATPPLFQQKCSACHKTAAEFVRRSVVQKDGALLGRSNQTPLSDFLKNHGGLRADEVAVVVDTLTRVLSEVRRDTNK